MDYLKRAPETDRYNLVRKVVTISGYCGGNRSAELRGLTQNSVKEDPEGYRFTFVPAKQRQHVKTARYKFLIKTNTSQSILF